MAHGSSIIRERQGAIRRALDRRNISMKIIAMDSEIPYATLLTYFPADRNKEAVQIPGGAIYDLIEHQAMPDDLLSMLLPDGAHILRGSEEIDHDAMARVAHEYLATLLAVHNPDATELSDAEISALDMKAAHLQAVVS
jgi:hypothetical protein